MLQSVRARPVSEAETNVLGHGGGEYLPNGWGDDRVLRLAWRWSSTQQHWLLSVISILVLDIGNSADHCQV